MADEVAITPALLREWRLPDRAGTKDDRGGVLVIGGARRTPGAAMLTGLAALRIGAGRLTLAVAGSVAVQVAVAVPEAGVLALPETPEGSPTGEGLDRLTVELDRADVVVVGPGLDEPVGAARLVREVLGRVRDDMPVVLDAFALGVLADLREELAPSAGRLVLTPNLAEAARLLERDDVPAERAAVEVAERYGATVVCAARVAAPDGRLWHSSTGTGGLGTSGSGDVLAGAVGGLLAGGCPPEQAACWGVYVHAAAGDRLASSIGQLGYLAREVSQELPRVLAELRV